ncbi:PKD domain-containing protein [Candidatus Peregrinibacteria bacterium]|nr:PKD domain-containing protein [Candidatus Peregrinibacteria bacterium]
MLKRFGTSLVALAIALMVGVGGAWASAKVQVKIGERVDLVAESLNPNATFKWIVKKGEEILSTQSTRNFSFTFPTQGEYRINLTATSGSSVESTTALVMVGDLYQTPSGELPGTMTPGAPAPLSLVLETLPALSGEKRVTLLGDSGRVSFLLEKSAGEILEYRIDKNIFVDSDGNGVSNDDIDNANDNSYLTGKPWQTDYKAGEVPKIVAEVTLVDKQGRKAKEQAEIVFEKLDTKGDPLAVLEVSPDPDPKDNLVHLYDNPHTVTFYARHSKGKIVEYRIDKDIFTDSDANGNPGDDIDNLNDLSFKNGDVWTTTYAKSDKQIIAQLIAVGEGGKGSRVQKGLVFGDKPVQVISGATGGIQLVADKDFVVKGNPITFSVEGLALSQDQYTFGWDFNGDGTVDQEIEGRNVAQNIFDTPGVFTVKVTITDTHGQTADKTLEIVVKDTVVTKADFSFEITGNTVQFKDLSSIAMNLTDKALTYLWSFGDTDPAGYEKQKDQTGVQNPVYTYSKAGKYIVTLAITDADQATDSKVAEIEIAQDLVAPTEGQPATETPTTTTGEPAAGGSLALKIVKVLLYLILIIVALVILIVGGFLTFLKVKNPSLTFEELVGEFKHKILSMIGAHDEDDLGTPPAEGYPKMPNSAKASSGTPHSEPKPKPVEEVKPPDWAQKKEAIEGEVEESKHDDDDKTPPPPVGEQGPVPDWLKGVK